MKKVFTFIILLCTTMLFAQESKVKLADAKEKVNDYAYYELKADLSHLTQSEQ